MNLKLNLSVQNAKLEKGIPTEIVKMLDYSDQIDVVTSVPPRFDCKKCDGKMVPIYYVGAKGRIYEYTEG